MPGNDRVGEQSFALRQDGMIVAEVTGADRQQCLREIMHYAMVYSRDGACTVEGFSPEDWAAILRVMIAAAHKDT